MGDQAPAGQLVAWLGVADGGTDLLGGKAASIDRLARLGVATPPGFCVTTAAFRRQLLEGPAGQMSADALARLPAEQARETLVSLAMETELLPELRAELAAALERLDGEARATAALAPGRFAVRSSAVGEDGTVSSFAGMHDTELGVAPGDVEAAVRRCWASLWSERAIRYRALRGLPLDGGAMAVAVQLLVPARAAAVVFTRHPVTGSAGEIFVNAVPGLGDALVSGEVNPDTYLLDKGTLAVLEQHPGDGVSALALDASQLHALATVAAEIERRFGQPVDIEAALTEERWYLLQARPITTR